MNNFETIVANAHCVECKDFVEPVGRYAHAELCTRDEDAATVVVLVNEMDQMLLTLTA